MRLEKFIKDIANLYYLIIKRIECQQQKKQEKIKNKRIVRMKIKKFLHNKLTI